jgi:hypothetical protein
MKANLTRYSLVLFFILAVTGKTRANAIWPGEEECFGKVAGARCRTEERGVCRIVGCSKGRNCTDDDSGSLVCEDGRCLVCRLEDGPPSDSGLSSILDAANNTTNDGSIVPDAEIKSHASGGCQISRVSNTPQLFPWVLVIMYAIIFSLRRRSKYLPSLPSR